MLEQLLQKANDPADEADLRHEVAVFVQSLRASAGQGDRHQVHQAETAVEANPLGAFTFDDTGFATLAAAGNSWQAGRFETPSLAGLRERVSRSPASTDDTHTRLWVLDGASPATDIGALQANAGERALFQVASQFNCLEATGPHVAPVVDYFHDSTQGPRASISAFPATLLRHYAAPAPDGERFVQRTDGRQIDLLADAFAPGQSPVRNGYLLGHGGMGPAALVAALEAGFDRLRVGVHEAAPVVLGYNWDGAVPAFDIRVAQVFTSTVAGGGYGGERSLGTEFQAACRLLLRVAYLGTLLAAVALGRTPAVLTCIGGGVFHNPIELIWESIRWAFDQVQPLAVGPLDVVLNGYNLSTMLPLDRILPDVQARGGAILRFDATGLVEIRR